MEDLPLAVKLETTHKPAKPPTNQPNHPQNTLKPAKPPTKHPQTSQTTHKIAKNWMNHPLINQKSHLFFPKTFIMIRYKFRTQQLQHLLPHKIRPFCSSRTLGEEREIGASFDAPARFRISPYPLHSFLPSLIAD